MTTPKSVAIRVGVEGEAEIERKLAQTAAKGEAAFDRIGAAALGASAQVQQGAQGVADGLQKQTDNVVRLAKQQDAQMRAYTQHLREQDAMAGRLRDAIDPLGAATRAYNKELADLAALARRGKISNEELAAAEALVKRRLDETTAALKRRNAANDGGRGLSTNAKTNMLYQGTDVVTSLAGGMNPGMVALQQGGQIMGILAAEGIKVSGAMLAAGAGVGVLVAAVAGGAAAVIHFSNEQAKLTIATAGLGRTAGLTATDLEKLAMSAAEASDISVAGARDMAVAYVETGRIGGAVLGDLIALTRDYAVTTRQDAKAATGELATALAKPAEGVALLNQRLYFLSAAEQEHIQNLVRAGHEADAQRIMVDRLAAAINGAAGQTSLWDRFWHNLGVTASNTLDIIGRKLTGGGAEQQLALLIRQRENLANSRYSPGLDQSDILARLDRQIAAKRAEIEKPAKDAEERRRNQQSLDTRAAFNSLNPQQAQIAAVRGQQARMRAALADPKLLSATGLTAAEAKAAIAQGDRQIEQLGKRAAGTARVTDSTVRQTAAMIASTKAGIDLAEAYLKGSEAGLKAEAVRKGLTDATRRGTDTDAQAARQLALDLSEAAVAGAKQIDQLRAQQGAQKAVNDAVAAGTLTADKMGEAMAIELAVRPLVIAQTLAEGEAKATLTKVIEALRRGMAGVNDEQGRAQLLAANDNDQRRIAAMEKELTLVRATSRERAIAMAQFDEEQKLLAQGFKPDDPLFKSRVANAGRVAQAQADLSAGNAGDRMLDDQERSIQFLRAESALVRASATERERVLAQLELKLRLEEAGIDPLSEQGRLITANAESIERYNVKLREQQAAWGELTTLGEGVIDTLGTALTPDHWGDWREAGKAAIRDILVEMRKLMLLNPLKNKLFGTDLPTWGGIKGLFGGKGAAIGGGGISLGGMGVGALEAAGFTSNFGNTLPSWIKAYASGTDYAAGGLALVGENGPELAMLPRGSKVRNSSDTAARLRRAMGAGAAVAAAPVIHLTTKVYADNSLVADQFMNTVRVAHQDAIRQARDMVWDQAPQAVAMARQQGKVA